MSLITRSTGIHNHLSSKPKKHHAPKAAEPEGARRKDPPFGKLQFGSDSSAPSAYKSIFKL